MKTMIEDLKMIAVRLEAAHTRLCSSRPYIMVMRDDRFWLVGPFPTQSAAADWGDDAANNPDDDPRWQTVLLVDPTRPVLIRDPGDGPMV